MTDENIEERIVWQPQGFYESGWDFAVLLNRNFAKEMLDIQLTREQQEEMNQLAERLGIKDLE